MRDKIEWHLRPIDRALASVLSAVLRVLAQKEPRQRDLKPDVPQHVCQLMHRVFSRMRPPFIVRIVVAGRSQSIVGRSTDQQLEDITDASDIRSRDHEMAPGLQTSIGFRQQMKWRGEMFDDFQRKYELCGIIGERDFLPVPFRGKLLSGRIQIDGENLHIGIPFHKLDELRTGHQSGAEQTRPSRRLDPTQKTQ